MGNLFHLRIENNIHGLLTQTAFEGNKGMNGQIERLLISVCDRRTYVGWVFTLSFIFVIMQIPYLLIVDANSPLFVVSALNLIGLSVFAGISGATLRYCA